MKIQLFDFKNKLKEKFGYSDNFAEDLSVVADTLDDYLGECVYDAVLSCKYIIPKNNSKEDLENDLKEAGVLNPSNLDIRNGQLTKQSLYYSEPTQLNDTNLTAPTRVIVLPSNYDFSAPLSQAALIKETIKLVFSYFNEYSFENKFIKKREGLSIKTLSKDLKEISNIGQGLENGIVSYLTEEIMKKELCESFEMQENDYEKLAAGYLLDNIGLREELFSASLSGKNDELKNILGDNYNNLITILDSLNRLEKQKRNSVTNTALLETIIKRIDREFGLVGSKMQSINASLTPNVKRSIQEKKIA